MAQAEHIKKEKLKEANTAPAHDEAAKKRNNSNNVDPSKPKDRTKEFAAKPVGLSATVEDRGKHNGKGKKKKNLSAVQDSEKTHKSTAANSLFQLLVSEETVMVKTNSRSGEEDTAQVATQTPYYK